MLKLMSSLAPFERGISNECRTPILVAESNYTRQLIQPSDMLVPILTPFVFNILSL